MLFQKLHRRYRQKLKTLLLRSLNRRALWHVSTLEFIQFPHLDRLFSLDQAERLGLVSHLLRDSTKLVVGDHPSLQRVSSIDPDLISPREKYTCIQKSKLSTQIYSSWLHLTETLTYLCAVLFLYSQPRFSPIFRAGCLRVEPRKIFSSPNLVLSCWRSTSWEAVLFSNMHAPKESR